MWHWNIILHAEKQAVQDKPQQCWVVTVSLFEPLPSVCLVCRSNELHAVSPLWTKSTNTRSSAFHKTMPIILGTKSTLLNFFFWRRINVSPYHEVYLCLQCNMMQQSFITSDDLVQKCPTGCFVMDQIF